MWKVRVAMLAAILGTVAGFLGIEGGTGTGP
jgi:hypothetical protein